MLGANSRVKCVLKDLQRKSSFEMLRKTCISLEWWVDMGV